MCSNIQTENLILEIQARPAIWDMQHEDYANKIKRKRSWEEIVNLFTTEDDSTEEKTEMGNTLQKKWKNIRDRYCRDLLKRKPKSGDVAKIRAPYRYSLQLSFLKDVLKPRPSTSYMDDELEDSEPNEDIQNVPSTSCEHEIPSTETQRPKRTAIRKIRKVLTVEAKREHKEKVEDDDDRLFLLSLLPQLKLLPPHLKLSARMDILQAVQKYVVQPPPFQYQSSP